MNGFSLPVILVLFASLSVSQVFGFTACVSPKPIYNTGLCYEGCPSGFTGAGPLCVLQLSCGDFHTDIGLSCVPKSYGRGVGVPIQVSCRSDETLDGLLCYDKCRSGYKGVGPVCWEVCSGSYKDHGATCYKSITKWHFKKSYGRGAGRAADSGCKSGYVLSGALCYPSCRSGYNGVGPVCWATGCPSGTKKVAVDGNCAKISTPRIGTTFGDCKSNSFIGNRGPASSFSTPFTMIIANDPQLIWWEDPSGATACNGNKDCKETNAKAEALSQVRAMNRVTSLGTWPGSTKAISKPKGVIINGDLTAYFHPKEFDLFEKYYIFRSNAPHSDVLTYPVYLGLGNHDYQNNVKDCWWAREPRYTLLGNNGCAQKAVDYIKGMMSCGRIKTFPENQIVNYHSASLAYSWNMGKYHFIQLHNYPSYTSSSIGISSSMNWLEDDLKRARAKNNIIIVNLHDLDKDFKAPDRDIFSALLDQYKVAGIFCGHITGGSNLGYQGMFGTVPYFRGGHGGQDNRNKFLLVEFADTYYRVLSVSSLGGSAKVVSTTDDTFDKTITL